MEEAPKIENAMNRLIVSLEGKIDTNLISDGYHAFGELYEHRIILWIQHCKMAHHYGDLAFGQISPVWRSQLHSDGSAIDGWFVLGMFKAAGAQITYHLPMKYWSRCEFAETLERAPEFDGHTSAEVLERLSKL